MISGVPISLHLLIRSYVLSTLQGGKHPQLVAAGKLSLGLRRTTHTCCDNPAPIATNSSQNTTNQFFLYLQPN